MAKDDKAHGADHGRVEHWKEDPDDHDYPAAADYLTLLMSDVEASPVVDALRAAPLIHRKAKDLLRASRLALLDASNVHVAEDLAKVHQGERLSPVLLVRGSLLLDAALTVADGYHRICASYHLDENAEIPCRLVAPPGPAGGPGANVAEGASPTRSSGPADT